MTMAPHEGWSDWIKNPSGVPNIIPELDRRGFSEKEIAQLMGGNWMRIFGETFKPHP